MAHGEARGARSRKATSEKATSEKVSSHGTAGRKAAGRKAARKASLDGAATATGPTLAFERAAAQRLGPLAVICGVDEVGRGPLAGPVVAAAAVLPLDDPDLEALIAALDDSKKLTARRRERLAAELLAEPKALVALGAASVREIDALNILRATDLAMARAVARLSRRLGRAPDHALVDGSRAPATLGVAAEAVVRGDGRCGTIAAASIVAKVVRDRAMALLDARRPGYGWARNAGYPTAAHRAAIDALGLTPHHRSSFRCRPESAPRAARP